MKFAREGYRPATVVAVVGLGVGALAGWAFGSVVLLVALAVLMFFRDPRRVPLGGSHSILAPADGRVVSVAHDRPHPLLEEACQRVSIFMSPLDVHVNRSPVDGTVERIEYRRGRFGAAYRGDASSTNESNAIVVRADGGYRIVVVQIAGWLARRIVCDVEGGAGLRRGERFGLIMFGSRVDVYLPRGISIAVKAGTRVRAGRTVIAEPTAEGDTASDARRRHEE